MIRKSSIELLKIFGIFLIVINHVTETLGAANELVNFSDYVVTLGKATSDLQVILLMLLCQAGPLGNTIFFVCSAWFLVDKVGAARRKAFLLLSSVWWISITMLFVYLAIDCCDLTLKVIVRQVLPTCFANNWYMTCYILFLFIYPWLNRLIDIIEQKQLFRIVFFSSGLWIVIDYFMSSWFFPSSIILWITVYFLIAYLKKYCVHLMNNCRYGGIILLVGALGYIGQVVLTNLIGLNFGVFSSEVLRWNSASSPFYIMIAIGSLNLALHARYRSRLINYISGLSMFVYLFHENYLFKVYTRPAIWQYLYMNYGYSHIVVMDLLYALILFLVSIAISSIYKETLQRWVVAISSRTFSTASSIYSRLEKRLIKD